jgi:hypothetical protein
VRVLEGIKRNNGLEVWNSLYKMASSASGRMAVA